MKVTVTTNAEAIARATEQLGERVATVAVRRALNRTLMNLRTELSKLIGKRVNLKAADIKEALGTKEATNSDLTALLEVFYANADGDRGRGTMPLKRYGAKPTRRGVTAQILRGEGRKPISRGFIPEKKHKDAIDLGGHVFQRKGPMRVASKGRYKGKLRQPIWKMYGPSVLTQAAPILEKLRADGWIDGRLAENLKQQIDHEMSKRTGRGS